MGSSSAYNLMAEGPDIVLGMYMIMKEDPDFMLGMGFIIGRAPVYCVHVLSYRERSRTCFIQVI